ncbi:hypothetical protein CIB48_g12347, partial [Xylaria polymorpha]
MVDYSKWDALELSDDSDIEVHPNVDKRSFIRAKQSQIHMERQQKKAQIEALKYERVINNTLMQRVSLLLSALKSHAHEASSCNPADLAFQAVIESAPPSNEEDTPPPRPEGVFDADQPLPTYSKMMARLLDEINKTLNENHIDQDKRYEALMEEVNKNLQKIQDLQEELVNKLDELEKADATKITSESYRIGFDSSHISKTKPGDDSKATKAELLNPGYDVNKASSDTSTSDEEVRMSPALKEFAQIKASDYRASQEFISSHPEILKESETDGLLIEAFNAALEQNDEARAWQCVHQAMVLQWCRMLGRDGVALFFKRLNTPGHEARNVFKKDVAEKFKRIREIAKKNAKQHDVDGKAEEQIQLHTVEPGTSIRIQIPPMESEDEEVRKARAIFDGFAPEMRAALESGSLDQVNEVLGTMKVPEAENTVSLLSDAGCLGLEEEIIDATTEEGRKRLEDMEEAVV